MGEACVDARGSRLQDGFGALACGAKGVTHVVDHETPLAFHVADDIRDFDFPSSWPSLVDDDEITLDDVGVSPCPLYAAGIGRDNRRALVMATKVLFHRVARIDICHRNVEEPLDLGRVKVNGENSLHAHGLQEIRNSLRRNGRA